jgi:protein-tyrosine phosphatase
LNLKTMIDLHSHFLPGIDDGAKDMDMTIDMLHQAESLGFKALLATPHINEYTTPEIISQITQIFERVVSEKNNAGINLELGLSGEIQFDTNLPNWVQYDFLKIGKKKKYIIFDLPIQGLPINIEDILFQLGLKGVIPVLAHPERNTYIQRHPERLNKWIELGCVMQMNAGSLTGNFGSAIKQLSWKILQNQQIHLVCSDAHDTKRRTYQLQFSAYKQVREQLSESFAQNLFITNPQNIWNGENISLPELSDDVLKIPMHEKFIRRVKSGLKRPITY